MRLRIQLTKSLNASEFEDVNWYKDVQDFPALVSYYGSNYRWIYYDMSEDAGDIDYVLTFTQLSHDDPDYFTKAISVEEIKWACHSTQCECGAEKVYGKTTGHSFWCPKWKKI